MFAVWLLVSALLCYAIAAYMWSPPQKQFDNEYEEAERRYRQQETAMSHFGMLVNRWHYKLICSRGIAVIVISATWLVVTAIWIKS